MPARFDANILLIHDRLAQLKDSLASPEATEKSRKRIESQIRVAEQALQHILQLQQAQGTGKPSRE